MIILDNLLLKNRHFLLFLFFIVTQTPSYSQRFPENYYRAQAALINQNYTLAGVYIDSAIANNSSNPNFWLLRGEINYRKLNFHEAINDFLIAEKHRKETAYYWLARSYSMLSDTATAFEYLLLHLALPNKQFEATILLDSAFVSLHLTPRWKKIWLTDWYSANERLLAEVAYLFSLKDWDGVIDLLNQRFDGRSVRHQFLAYRGEAYYYTASYRAAETDFSSALKLNRRNHRYMAWLSRSCIAQGKLRKGIRLLGTAIDLSGGEPTYFALRADAFAKMNDFERATEDILYYLSFYPDDKEAISLFVLCAIETRRYIAALSHLNRLIKLQPIAWDNYYQRAYIYMQSDNWHVALIDLNEAVRLNPTSKEAFLRRGICFQKLGRIKDACSDWREAQKLGSFDAQEYLYKYCR